ncbi:hypothetical protein GCM10018780_08980 [Streptomyces lanatus]|nr:hypothetical protein GCM10018780_08980 [Streptomyces lanatus]
MTRTLTCTDNILRTPCDVPDTLSPLALVPPSPSPTASVLPPPALR